MKGRGNASETRKKGPNCSKNRQAHQKWRDGAGCSGEYFSSLLVGSDDTNTRPPVVQDYVTRARAAGVDIGYVEIAGGQHGFGSVARNQPQFDAALRSLISSAPALSVQAVPTLTHMAQTLLVLALLVIGMLRIRQGRQ